jgi:cytochrome c oxidase assembly protein subunit 15
MPASPIDARRLGLGFGLLGAATYALIVLGTLVRAHGAGLACPDWPLCFGELVPSFDLRVGFEWGHRALAGSIALGFAGLAALALRAAPLRSSLAAPLALGALLLAAQLLLGALTVWLRLASWTVTAHLLVGTAFCATLVWIAVALFEAVHPPERSPISTRVRAGVALAAALVVVQLLLGGLVASHGAGLACAHFPTCDGGSLAPSLHGLVGLHVLHRIGAVLLLAAFVALAVATRGASRLGPLARAGLHLVLLQIAVGAGNVLLRLPVEITGLHSALAAAIALLGLLQLREALLAPALSRAPRRALLEAQ